MIAGIVAQQALIAQSSGGSGFRLVDQKGQGGGPYSSFTLTPSGDDTSEDRLCLLTYHFARVTGTRYFTAATIGGLTTTGLEYAYGSAYKAGFRWVVVPAGTSADVQLNWNSTGVDTCFCSLYELKGFGTGPTSQANGGGSLDTVDGGISFHTANRLQDAWASPTGMIFDASATTGSLPSSDAHLTTDGTALTIDPATAVSLAFQPDATSAGDPYWDNVVLLMSFDDAENRLLDKTGRHTPVEIGTPTYQAGVFGGQAMWGGNSTANYIQVPNSPDFQFGAGDFTVEFWNDQQNLDNDSGFVGMYRTSSNQRSWAVVRITAQVSTYLSTSGSSGTAIIDSGGLESASFQHIALTREGDTLRLFRGGVLMDSGTISGALFDSTAPLEIGTYNLVTPARGYIDEVRITKGVCRYNENFAPPNAPFLDY